MDVPATLAAVLLTATGFVAVLLANAPPARVPPWSRGDDRPVRSERIAFVAPRTPPLPLPGLAASAARPGAKAHSRTVEMAPSISARQDVDTTTKQAVTAHAAPPVVSAPSLVPTIEAARGLRPSPFTLPRVRNPFAPGTPLTRGEEDSVRLEFGVMLPRLARNRAPTVAERDSLMRVAARESVIPGRRASFPAALGGGISAPLFSAGPSPAERRRDSIGNAEYVARLSRLQERARLRKDSIRIADSSSKRGVPE